MKKLTLILLFSISTAFAQTEKYYVTFISNDVILQRTGKALKLGDAMLPSDKLIFKNKGAKISCISPGKGRFDLNGEQVRPGAGGELLAVLKGNLVPSEKTMHLSTRSLPGSGYNPETYFVAPETSDRILLIENEVLPISTSYKRDPQNFFFIQYNDNSKIVTRKIAQNDTGLIFDSSLFTGAATPQKVKICYQSNKSGSARSSQIAEFTPVLLSKETLSQQVKILEAYSGIKDKKLLIAEILTHLAANYGKIGADEIPAFLTD